MAVPYHIHTFEIPVATDAEVAAGVISNKVVVPSNLGTAAQSDVGDFATSTQGTLADSAVQPGDLGGAATLNVGTAAGTVAAGDDSRIVNAVQATRAVNTGAGLTGGGDLSADRAVALNSSSIASLALADSAVQQTNEFASAGLAVKLGTIANGSTANSIIGDPGDGSPIPSTLFATADYPFYSVGGYVPGPHMYGGTVLTMKTTRDENAQEQALAIQFINETGKPASPGGGGINNGKSGLTVHGRAINGGGNMWGAAIAVDIETGYDHGFVAIVELDITNRNKNSVLGGDFNVAGIFMNSISQYTSTAGIWMTGYDLQPNKTWLYGMFFQGPMVIKDATILEDSGSDVVLKVNGPGTTQVTSGKNLHTIAIVQNLSTSPYLILDGGYHTTATFRDASTSPIGIDIAGTKSTFDVRLNGGALVGLSIQGARSTAIIDVSTATGGPALNMANAQVLKWTDTDILQFGAELLFRKTGGAVMGRFSPTVTNNELNLIATARISAADTERRFKFGATGTGPGGVGRAVYIDN